MHGRQPFLSQLLFGRGGGRDGEHFFLRVDFHDRTAVTPEHMELHIGVRFNAVSSAGPPRHGEGPALSGLPRLPRAESRGVEGSVVEGAVIVRFHRSEAGESIQCEIRLEERTPASSAVIPPKQDEPPAQPALGQAALDMVFELRLSLSALGLPADQPFEFQVTLWENNLPVETLPLEGWLAVPV
jgi:hypothetical protein